MELKQYFICKSGLTLLFNSRDYLPPNPRLHRICSLREYAHSYRRRKTNTRRLGKNIRCPRILSFLFYLISILRICSAVDTITVNQLIRDCETITSAGGSFELGFFSPGSSKNRYLGIWYKKVATGTVVWVANREIPLSDLSGVLKQTDQGDLVILNGTNSIIWSSNPSRSAQNPNVQLLESGNLVMKNGNDSDPENFLWQSFDYPGNTLLPGMKLGRDKVTGLALQEIYLIVTKF